MFRYELVRKYYEDHQTIDIPRTVVVDGVWLGKWIIAQKKMYEQGYLSEEQKELLDKLPMGQVGKTSKTDRNNTTWRAAYNEILSFYNENGNINIPTNVIGEKTGINLSNWILRQRKSFTLGQLSEEQIELLNKVKFVWVIKTAWEEGYRHAKEYFLVNGNLTMSQSYKCSDGYALGRWLFDYRRSYNGKKARAVITREQIAALEEIGMEW